MPAGTIALTNNSATVNGTGTAFTTELKTGDFIAVTVGGAPFTMIVTSITSNTQLTIALAYNGPTASGLAWYGMPATLNYAIEQSVLNDMASNLRGMVAQMNNWQKIYSDAASVTVERPDRSTFTGPSWGYMSAQYAGKADKAALDDYAKKGANTDITSLTGLTTAISIAQGGTGATTQSGAQSALGMGNAAVRQVTASPTDTTAGRVMQVGDFGLGGAGNGLTIGTDAGMLAWLRGNPSQYYRNNTNTNYGFSFSAAFHATVGNTYTSICAGYTGQGVRIVTGDSGATVATNIYDLWTSKNTTIDTNNFIKRASPIARLTNDVSQMQPDFAVDEQHIVAGLVSVNDEAEGVSAEKIAVGVYQVRGAKGMAFEGWTLEVPQDINGNRLCFVEMSADKEGVITVSVFKRRFDVDSAMIVAGEPMDIPEGRWIDLRLQMPEDSAWNTRMREMEQAAEREEQTS